MQSRLFSASRFALPACLALGWASATAEAALHKLTPLDSVPVGMEMDFAGTSVEGVQGILNVEALTRDHAGEVHLTAGASQVIFKFSRQAILRGLSFINDGMQGEVRLQASHDGKHWTALTSERFSSADRQVSVSPGCAQGRFLKLEFDSRHGGTLRCLRIQGADTAMDYRVVQDAAGKPVNFASGLGGGRMVYASPASSGRERMVVYDLGQPRQLTEFASVHSRQPVGLKVYALSALPVKEDWRGRLQADPSLVGQPGQLVAEAEDAFGSGHVRIRLPKPVTTRYLAMAWQGSADLADFKAYEIAASGAGIVTRGALAAEQAPVLAVQAPSVPSVPGAAEATTAEEAVAEATSVLASVQSVKSENPRSEVPAAAPVVQASLQPQRAWGYFAGSMGGYSAAQSGMRGILQDKTGATGTRQLRKANEVPVEEGEPEEFEGPAFGIEWCLSPSAT